MPDDNYARYYAAKLWRLVPAIYRALDSEPAEPGALREIVNRIGAQAAVLRRGIDRLWEDQSIESCDDWLIPYIGDLLATRLVACLDARGQRLDVAKTIYYRRRKGTVGLLEELASDIAGHDARVVEFFRRLGRTRHSFDPPIGQVPRLSAGAAPGGPLWLTVAVDAKAQAPAAVVEGLAGACTRTPMGGYADLRHAYGATKAQTAFDEYFHTADFRRGRQSVGWQNIPRLGVFSWWLASFSVPASTPVEDKHYPGQFTFDPTGREIPLFARSRRTLERFGEHWISPDEWQLPVRIGQPLWQVRGAFLYPDACRVLEGDTAPFSTMGLDRVDVNPERGRFRLMGVAPAGGTVHGAYCHGFGASLGAGPYDQRQRGGKLPGLVEPVLAVQGGGGDLAAKAAALGTEGSLVIGDSLTYGPPANIDGLLKVAIVGKNLERPVVRWTKEPRPEWVITGAGNAELVLQGLYLVGADVVLRGSFASVRITCSTLDPGTSGAGLCHPAPYSQSVDGFDLAPTRLFIEAKVGVLAVERSITGPIRTRDGGGVKTLQISDSTVQAIAKVPGGVFSADDLYDAGGLAAKLAAAHDPLSQFLRGQLSAAGLSLVDAYALPAIPSDALRQQLLAELNAVVAGASIYTSARFAQIRLSAQTLALAGQTLAGQALADFNRRLLEEAYRNALSAQAIATESGWARLERTTVLGPVSVHRLDASECILDGVAIAEDAQHGCVRFSAYAEGSVVRQPYESVTVAPDAPLFITRLFGDPEYARLRSSVDLEIITGRVGASILEGAENGSEMGAFGLEAIPLKKRGLSQKFAEYMPIGMMPVWINVT